MFLILALSVRHFELPIRVMLRPTGRPTVLRLVRVWSRAARSFAGLEILLLLRLVLTTVECGIGGRGLHGLNLGLLLVRADDVDELIGCDRIIREMSDLLPEMFRESAADEDCNVGVWQALATEYSDHPIVFAFARHEIFEFCRLIKADVDDGREV